MSAADKVLNRLRKLNTQALLRQRQRRFDAIAKRQATMAERYSTTGAHVNHLRMIVSPWFNDENGIPTRQIWAAE